MVESARAVGKKAKAATGLPLLRCWVRCLCGRRLVLAEAGLAAAFGFEDLLGFAAAAAGLGEGRTHGREILAFDDQFDLVGVQGLTLEQGGCHAVHDLLIGL